MDESAVQRNVSQLEELVEDTSALSASLKRRIKALERQGGSGRDGQIRKQQVRALICRGFRQVTHITGLDRPCEVEICGSNSELPDCGTTIPNEVQAENGKTIQNWHVLGSSWGCYLLTIRLK